MHKVVNAINNAFRYRKDCFKVKKNSKTILFLKCLVKSNVIRYFKETQEKVVLGYINPSKSFDIKLISKGGRKIYFGNSKIKINMHCFFIYSNGLKKSYLNSFDRPKRMSGELVVKIFI
jgi:ribosomal protein S8